jgi:hypothetical protein
MHQNGIICGVPLLQTRLYRRIRMRISVVSIHSQCRLRVAIQGPTSENCSPRSSANMALSRIVELGRLGGAR